MKYKFAIPVKIRFIADESNLSIESIEDLEEIQEKYDIDIQYIIDECEYKIEMEDIDMFDDEFYGVHKIGIFDDVINDNWNEIVQSLNKDIELNKLDKENLNKIFNYIKNDFNKSNLIKKSVIKFNNNQKFNIDYINITDFDQNKNEIYIDIITNKELFKLDLNNINSWLEYQVNENWGEYISNIDLSDEINEHDFYVYLIPWSLKNDIKIIN